MSSTLVRAALEAPSGTPATLTLNPFETNAEHFGDVPGIWFFECCENMDAESLRRSLAVWLARVPMYAGRLIKASKSHLAVRLCNTGVPFEVVQNVPYVKFEHADDASVAAAVKLAPRLGAPNGGPLMTVRLIQFADGKGCALAVTFLHLIADAQTAFTFMKHWATVHRALLANTAPPNIDVCTDRAVVTAGVQAAPLTPLSPGNVLRRISMWQGLGLVASIVWNLPWLGTSYIELSPDTVERIRALASVDLPSGRTVTANAAISAFVARALFQHLGRTGDQPCAVGTAVNLRKRKSTIPTTYLGDAIAIVPHQFPSAAALQSQPLSATALALFDSYAHVNDAFVNGEAAFIDAAVREGADRSLLTTLEINRDIIFTNWTQFPVYDCDFGSGAPYGYVPIAPPFSNAHLFLPAPPSRGKGTILFGMNNNKAAREAIRKAFNAALSEGGAAK